MPEIDALFSPFLKISKSEFLIQDLISRLTVNQNEISVLISNEISNFGCWQSETNQILKIEDVAIVSWLAKHLLFTHQVLDKTFQFPKN